MFGYVRYYEDELRLSDFHLFRSYYCGLCRCLKQDFGQKGRFLLNYDMVFFAISIDGLSEEPMREGYGHCPFQPWKRRRMVMDSPGLKKAALLTMLMGYHKLKDNWQDDRSALALLGLGLYKGAYRKGERMAPILAARVERDLARFYAGEKKDNFGLDEMADPFAQLTGAVLEESAGANESAALSKLGYHCGRWIYLIDALDDLPKDWANGSTNPLIRSFPRVGEDWREFFSQNRKAIEDNLYFSLEEIHQIFAGLTTPHHRRLLENMYYLGIRGVTDMILWQRGAGLEQPFSNPLRVRTLCSHRNTNGTEQI